jgi:hypothetical protein
VKDAGGQKLGYVYFDDPRAADKPLTRDEARRDRGQQNETAQSRRPRRADPSTAEQKNGKALLAARDTEGDYRRIGWTTRSASFL